MGWKWWERLKASMKKQQEENRQNYDVNSKDDLARRNMYPGLSDAEYNARFHNPVRRGIPPQEK
jgi:hypothetical protein